MTLRARKRISQTLFSLTVMCCVCGLALPSSAGPVPRILLVGDSWSALMQAFGTYQTVLPETPAFANYRSLGFRTAIVGIRADAFTDAKMLAIVADELAQNPTIDIVHLSLGGNDILYGSWNPSMTPAQKQAIFDEVTANIATVIDFILGLRPDIRIGLCGYTFANHTGNGLTPEAANEAVLGLERTKLAMVRSKSRVFYIHNLGLMQYTYGIPQADPPIAPGGVDYPGGYPTYSPMPGGNMAYGAPLEALVDSDIHLTPAGYAVVARRCISEFYGAWLSWPRVFEVQLQTKTATEAVFRVRFSESVTGVDAADFAATLQPGNEALTVTSLSGSEDTYTVTVQLSGNAGTPHLDVLDDDSIVDANTNALGGPGTGNGLFMHNGQLAYEDPKPIADDDFDAFLSALQISTAPYADFLGDFSFAPDRCDANGGFQGIDPVRINGNGLLDSCEFALISACLRNASLDLSATGGVTHAATAAAWQRNLAQMRSDLGGTSGLALSVLRGLDSILAGFFILGDSQSSMLPTLLVIAATNYKEFPLTLTVPDPSLYTTMPQSFGFNGDADGDGFTNKQEYQYFMPLGGKDLYVTAALSPYITPEPRCGNTEGGSFGEGESFCLTVPDVANLAGGFEWQKDGEPLTDGSGVVGSHWRELHITHLRRADAGVYECVYDNGSRVFGPINVNVEPLPALRPAGIVALAFALALAATRRVRARKSSTRS